MVARVVRDDEVAGSNPVTPTERAKRDKRPRASCPFFANEGGVERSDAVASRSDHPDVNAHDACGCRLLNVDETDLPLLSAH